jgi:hypothetical protein
MRPGAANAGPSDSTRKLADYSIQGCSFFNIATRHTGHFLRSAPIANCQLNCELPIPIVLNWSLTIGHCELSHRL